MYAAFSHIVCVLAEYVHFGYYLFSSWENKNLSVDVKWENVAESGSEKRKKSKFIARNVKWFNNFAIHLSIEFLRHEWQV